MNKSYKNKEELIASLILNSDTVLDVGFWGQGISIDQINWVHRLLQKHAHSVYGLDIDFDESTIASPEFYKKANAEFFEYNTKFDVIFAGDLIEHLSNPGLFLESCKKNLKRGGRLILTTPNCFNLFNIAGKLTREEPTVNFDHTFYFNRKTLVGLLNKNNFDLISYHFLYSADVYHKESFKKKFLNCIYWVLSLFTNKFKEVLVIVATPK